ncbi:DUF3597 domain-containing protein [uncultured Brevundimonas sp.]|uniref:DUF3597 domain-containing protein n=1 Tax=uncultured Brevundimonas sp. TaxID=213418 RepID=UPI0025F7BD0A|nr:DUF3597 domain-containing protein [uncultured Brevundimonas sp.]
MSIFGKILGGIWDRAKSGPGGHGKPKAAPEGAQPRMEPQVQPQAQPQAAPAPTPQPQAATPAAQPVDIEAVLDGLNAERAQKLNWRTSIVDLMKLVGLESSLSERKELADELGYTGDKSDSAAMNIWLHKQVLKKLQDNGGKVPADLAD